ncbi:Fungal transcriptional regulatory protein [Akanthomyces lecanii RCEF 1005]|uniref:Fungal transcriptional regulatory protein n=1 Tax=Akanthomyces lecanii RCEF 1005 TaxID=1081108 RepID=A0A162K5S7_CORDF|nr:Fungal transcriptional regulatory protein [Akanthomyces lecanii RCEF 1005]
MTRSKVLDEQRKRIGQACKGCQSRKQKCDGQSPCSGCEKRGHACTYDPDRKRKSISRIPKHGDYGPASKTMSLQFQGQVKLESGQSPTLRSPLGDNLLHPGAFEPASAMSEWGNTSDVPPDRLRSNAHPQVTPDAVPLPSRQTAERLVSVARQYSNHLVEILDEVTIQELLQTCYSELRPQDPGRTCLLYLLFAAGSATTEAQRKSEYSDSPLSDTLGEADKYFDFVEATLLRIGSFEHFEIWMIQAWALMTTYSLSASKWNAADAYIGLAVRAAYVLGINHVQGASPRAATEGKANAVHTKLWKCLFVLDSLVAALLGRQPQALKEDKCKPIAPGDCSPSSPNNGRDDCLEFNVASAKAIRKTLKLVYNPRHFPAEKAYSMLQQAQLQPQLGPVDSLATLHARLFRNYAMMLLTRPFFVQELYQSSKQKYSERSDTTWRYLSETCVSTAHRSIECIFESHNQSRQLTSDYMWRQCLFTAVLVILSNQFFGFNENPNSDTVISQAFTTLDQCSVRNPAEESEFNSLLSLRRLVDERRRRSLPMGRPVFLDMNHYGGAYDVHSESSRTSPVFPTHDFAAAAAAAAGCPNSTYCSSDGRRYSVQSIASSDYLESTVPQLHIWNGVIPGMNPPLRCGSDAGCYGFVQQDGYEGDAMHATQECTEFPGQQLYLS